MLFKDFHANEAGFKALTFLLELGTIRLSLDQKIYALIDLYLVYRSDWN